VYREKSCLRKLDEYNDEIRWVFIGVKSDLTFIKIIIKKIGDLTFIKIIVKKNCDLTFIKIIIKKNLKI
jgi:hypothetical protein